MVGRFQDFKDLSRFRHRIFRFFIETIEIEYCFGPTKIKFDLPKIPRCNVHPNIFNTLSKICLISYRIYVSFIGFMISKIYQDSTLAFPLSFKTIEIDDCVGPTRN